MPIKPENRSRYPKNWKQIRNQILERAKHCCEFCGVTNYDWGWRDKDDGSFERANNQAELEEAYLFAKHFNEPRVCPDTGARIIKIVLTIAHLDHTPENNDPSNLKALCQKCHLNYDQEHHAETAAATRLKKQAERDEANGQKMMFSGAK